MVRVETHNGSSFHLFLLLFPRGLSEGLVTIRIHLYFLLRNQSRVNRILESWQLLKRKTRPWARYSRYSWSLPNSFWGATVITNLLSPFPSLIEWVSGGHYVGIILFSIFRSLLE